MSGTMHPHVRQESVWGEALHGWVQILPSLERRIGAYEGNPLWMPGDSTSDASAWPGMTNGEDIMMMGTGIIAVHAVTDDDMLKGEVAIHISRGQRSRSAASSSCTFRILLSTPVRHAS